MTRGAAPETRRTSLAGCVLVLVAVSLPALACGGGTRVERPDVAATLVRLLDAQGRVPQPSQLEPGRARAMRGNYASISRWAELYGTGGRLYMRTDGVAAAPVVGDAGRLEAVDPNGRHISLEAREDGALVVDGAVLERHTERPEWEVADAWAELLGHYEWTGGEDTVQLILHERRGRPYAEIGGVVLLGGRWDGERVVLDGGPFPGSDLVPVREESGGVVGLRLGELEWTRTPVGTPAGETFRIEPVADVEQLRAAALAARPPAEEGQFREPDLVAVTEVEPDIRLDVRYASTNNFMGAVFYREAAAFLQRPAAEAVARVHRALAAEGFGLMIHDAYRPWYVTKMFWDATPEQQKQFVADPSDGSRHNRGAAVDLTLFDLATGEAVRMPGGYDEFSVRSYPEYVGGTSLQRWRRDLLRRAMEAADFDVYEFEWWHFDYRDWSRYPILDRTFDELERPR